MKVVTPGGAAQNASNETPEKSNRGRGRPRKIIVKESEGEQEVVSDGSPPVKKARGRPKGSLTKKVLDEEGKPDSNLPKKLPVKRGRPRKYPLPTPEELNKPKVWKKLGRPPKNPPASLSSPSCDVDIPKKRGRPPGNPKSDVGTPRKSDASSETKLETSLTEHPE
ncbi:hypothetical protein PBY51_007932 [Eleginops maclovinus]|uniref:Uncharacterized protein n=1 Tax=Eleginops maclovinus TaxID=56733 RepID=A0AAN7X699_ELEMC|nr:hypothetical protein PBY51_007932 [Eleginops maclovinus]